MQRTERRSFLKVSGLVMAGSTLATEEIRGGGDLLGSTVELPARDDEVTIISSAGG